MLRTVSLNVRMTLIECQGEQSFLLFTKSHQSRGLFLLLFVPSNTQPNQTNGLKMPEVSQLLPLSGCPSVFSPLYQAKTNVTSFLLFSRQPANVVVVEAPEMYCLQRNHPVMLLSFSPTTFTKLSRLLYSRHTRSIALDSNRLH